MAPTDPASDAWRMAHAEHLDRLGDPGPDTVPLPLADDGANPVRPATAADQPQPVDPLAPEPVRAGWPSTQAAEASPPQSQPFLPWVPPAARSRRLVLGIVAVGLLLSLVLALVQQRRNEAELALRLQELGHRTVNELQQRIQRYEYGLRGARGAIVAAGVERGSRGDFSRYAATRDVEREFPGANGFGFIRRVPDGEVAAMVSRARREGRPGFQIRDVGPAAGAVPSAVAPVPASGPASRARYIIDFIEPLAPNAQAEGLDIASEPRRRLAADRAMRTGLATLTAPLTLVQARGHTDGGFLVLLPVYRDDAPKATAAQREAALVGWSYAPLVYDEVVSDLVSAGQLMALTVSDLGGDAQAAPFYRSPDHEPARATGMAHVVQRRVFGREWRYTVMAGPGFARAQRLLSPWAVGTLGLMCTLGAAAFFHQREQSRLRAGEATTARQRLAAVVEHASDAIITETLDGRVTGWNRAAEQIFGWRSGEAIGRPLAELIGSPDSLHTSAEVLRLAGQGQVLQPFDTVRRRRDGRTVDVSVAASPIFDVHGRVVGVGKSLRDVTRRRQLERELQAMASSLERQVSDRTAELKAAHRDLTLILDALPSMVGYWDESLVNRFANRAFHEWYGQPAGRMPGQTLHELLSPEALQAQLPEVVQALNGQARSYMRDVRAPCNGERRHLLVHLLPDTLEGRTRGFYVLTHDVTELTESQRRLAASEAFLERAGEVARVGGWEWRVDTGALTWTRQSRRILGLPLGSEPSLGQVLRLLPRASRRTLRQALDAAVDAGKPWDLTLPMRSAQGRSLWVRTVGEPEYEGEGEQRRAVGVVGAVQDVTAGRQADEALRRLGAAEAANAAKSAFLAHVSHEMRTPLNAIIGFTHLLRRSDLDALQRQQLDHVHSAGQALLGTINDVLDLSKIEAGQMTLEDLPFSLHQLLDDVKGLMGPLAGQRGLSLALEGARDVPDWVVADGLRLRQILTNLLANAVKFTERGGVRVQASWAAEAPGSARSSPSGSKAAHGESELEAAMAPCGQLTVVVADTGIGIEPDALARLFEPFSQAEVSTTRRFGGTGLGLSIVRRLTSLMGGHIEVDSRPGVGSSFTVTVPLRLATVQERAAGQARSGRLDRRQQWLPGLQVLAVDDSPLNLEVLQQMLGFEGAAVATATDGRVALQRLREPGNHFDLVLMDLQMPGMDGVTATRALRADPALRDLPVIALTAGALLSVREGALEAGMDDFVTKPFEPDALLRSARRALALRRGSEWPVRARPIDPDGVAPVPAPPVLEGMDVAAALHRLHGDVPLLVRLLDRLASEAAIAPWADLPTDEPQARAMADRLRRAAATTAADAHTGSAAPVAPAGDAPAQPVPDDALTTAWTAPRMARWLHRLCGSAGIVGANAVSAASRQAQTLWAQEPQLAGQAVPAIAGQAASAGESPAPRASPASPSAPPADLWASRCLALVPLSLALKTLQDQAPAWRQWGEACLPPPAPPAGQQAHADSASLDATPSGALQALRLAVQRLAEQVRLRDLSALALWREIKPGWQRHDPGQAAALSELDHAIEELDFQHAQALLHRLGPSLGKVAALGPERAADHGADRLAEPVALSEAKA